METLAIADCFIYADFPLKDSVPKFLRDPRYSVVLQEHDVDIFGGPRSYSPNSAGPERTMSRTART